MYSLKLYRNKKWICFIIAGILALAIISTPIYFGYYDREHIYLLDSLLYGMVFLGVYVYSRGLKYSKLAENTKQEEDRQKTDMVHKQLAEEQAIQKLGLLVTQYNLNDPELTMYGQNIYPRNNIGNWLRYAGKYKESKSSDYPATQYLVDRTLAQLQDEMHHQKDALERYDEDLQAKKVKQKRALTSRETNSLIEKRAEIQERTNQAKEIFFSSCATAVKLGFNVWEKDNTLYLLLKLN